MPDDQNLDPTVAMGPDAAGTVIGRYFLLQKIGEGGMGEVWLAEQKEPVRRRVALKLVKAGMNSREVITRFESERQALALMTHASIARVLDAGSTPEGSPYFVMEYVAGSPITAYCDEHKLNTRERLELFLQVCDGVQHAHHKAIIHRDLKPSNILVTEVDGKAVVKIIDFGVAKALTHSLSADAMLTRVGTMIGTPEYMSPEQASSSGEDIDTRTDVYSLGVVFYELVAGVRPLDFKKAALHDFLKKLREDEPSKPSTSIRTRAESEKTQLTATRRTALPTLERELRGDLDAIALKAIEKDRSRRYSTPSDFAADIRRFLNHEAVLAVRPSLMYRSRKFARRYRVALAVAVAFVIVLVTATVISVRQSIRANREAAMARAVRDFLQDDLLLQANPAFQGGQPDPDVKMRTLVDRAAAQVGNRFKDQPAVEGYIRVTLARAYNGLSEYKGARVNLERAVELLRTSLGPNDPKTLEAETLLGLNMFNNGENEKAEALLVPLLEKSRRVLGKEANSTLAAMDYLVRLKARTGKLDEAIALGKEAVELEKRAEGPEAFNTLLSMQTLASAMYSKNQLAEAEAISKQVIDIDTRVTGPQSVLVRNSKNLLAQVYTKQGKFEEAESIFKTEIDAGVRTFGPEHGNQLAWMTALANLYVREKRYQEAESLHLKVLEIKRRVTGPSSRQTLNSLGYIASLYEQQEKYAQAEKYASELLTLRRQVSGAGPVTMDAAEDLARIFVDEKKFGAAKPLAREALQWDEKNRPNEWDTFFARSILGASLAGQKKFAEAEPLLLQGYEGMQTRKQQMDPDDLKEIPRVARWIAGMYDSWGKADEAAKWRGIAGR